VNSVVAKWLGLKKPVFTGRSGVRGCATFKSSHGFDPIFMMYFGNGFRSGVVPCDDKTVFWFFGWCPTSQGKPFTAVLGLHCFYLVFSRI
jgi:hypothetical protein